ncbi:MAG: UvrD-helicase domain-containing protein [Eubacteriaceae bacterium]|nr:UvrD-helicase domain-containing protein [Eubacteriaceae bacterium]
MGEAYLENLNERQKQAVLATEGYVRVVAGAGSGKTKTLAGRFVYLVSELGVSTSGILCVTFTNKAAFEMKKRIRTIIPDRDLGYVSTFHGFCVTFFKEEYHILGYPAAFIVLDSEDKDSMLKTIFTDMGITSKVMTIQQISDYIEIKKAELDYVPLLTDVDIDKIKKAEQVATDIKDKVMYRYFYEQRKVFGLDFCDLIYFTLYILRNNDQVREKWTDRMEYIMIDEYQDIDKDQYALSEILSEKHRNLFVVGDPDQTIYTWRGADVRFMLDFARNHNNTETIIMDLNYRCVPEILTASNTLIAFNANRIDKKLIANKPPGKKPLYFHAKSSKEEARFIADNIKLLAEGGLSYSNIGVLYRAHYISRNVEEELVAQKIPYVLYSGVEFYRRKEIKDVICYLRMIFSADDIAFLRTVNEPKRNIGKKRIEYLKNKADSEGMTLYNALKGSLNEDIMKSTGAKRYVQTLEKYREGYLEMTLTDLLTGLLVESGYEEFLRLAGETDRLDNLAELKRSVFEFEATAGEETTLGDYLGHIALFTNLDTSEKTAAVKLMTVHAAKGLEFPAVFVCGLSEGMFPAKRTLTPDKLEEERRLAYVALTRAMDRLYLSDAEGLNFDGSFRYPSRFVLNCGKENLEYMRELDEELLEGAKKAISRSESAAANEVAITEGARVRHRVFGEGTVLSADSVNKLIKIKFDALSTPRTLSFEVPLETLP